MPGDRRGGGDGEWRQRAKRHLSTWRINLPVVDPGRITCPVLMIGAEHDGITSDEDMAGFYAGLGSKDKQLVAMSSQACNITLGVNRHRFWHVLRGFLEMPERCRRGLRRVEASPILSSAISAGSASRTSGAGGGTWLAPLALSDTLPIELNAAALGIGRHVSGIADPFNAISTSSAPRTSSAPTALRGAR